MADRFLGFDVFTYPGDSTVAWLWAHGFRIAGFYLNHHRGSQDDSWIFRRAGLANSGWGLAPIYLGWQLVDRRGRRLPPPLHAEATAGADAAEATRLMRLAGFADGATLYLDLEDGTVPHGSYAEYVTAWTGHVATLGFTAGVYCSHRLAEWASAQNLPCWSYHVPLPARSHVTLPLDPATWPQDAIDVACIGTQIRQGVHVAGLPVAIDLSWFAVPNPSLPDSLDAVLV